MAADPQTLLASAELAARDARGAMEHPGLRAALERLEARYLDQIRASSPTDRDAREAAYFRLRALADLRADLSATAAAPSVIARNHRSVLKS